MKHLSRILTAVLLAVLTAALVPAQVFADSLPEYISEVKIYEGSYKDAEAEGFKILCGDDGKPVDLNQGSGSTDIGAKGNKKVYLGYKTTTDKDEAISDLALMNMKGGYSVEEYEALMEAQMKEQIIPFVDKFLATIGEYRENYNSKIEANKQRAQYVHDVLNKLIDDDTGKGLGDLLLNETKYEMGDAAYNALSAEEKKDHADILTIIAQANGKATMLMESLLTRAADTYDDTWLERFENTTYDDLAEMVGGSPSDVSKKLAREYDDAAQTILTMWEDFRSELANYEQAAENVENTDITEGDYDELETAVEALAAGADDDELIDTTNELVEKNVEALENIDDIGTVAVHDYLDSIDYGDGTMLDFFMQDYADVEDEPELLYPLVASLTEGQIAGLDFINLKTLVLLAETDVEAYKDTELENVDEQSIYKGVDRDIYKKGGVALTSDALRANAKALESEEDSNPFGTFTVIMMAVTGAAVVGLVGTAVAKLIIDRTLMSKVAYINKMVVMDAKYSSMNPNLVNVTKKSVKDINKLEKFKDNEANLRNETQSLNNSSQTCKSLMVGLTVAMIVMAAVTTYLSYRDMKAYYNVDFTPIPHYMVEEKDITAYNAKGEKIVLKNQSAYYKAVESNRKKGDSYFGDIGNLADMNGCVNPQWLALYAAKNEALEPILASSLKVVVGSATVPQGYETGIHMFGESAAFNLNSKLYCWNQSAKSVMVYYKTDAAAASAAGSNFSSGTIALAAGGGLLGGAAITALAMVSAGKRKGKKYAEA